jgi:hypothetical protein
MRFRATNHPMRKLLKGLSFVLFALFVVIHLIP